MVVGPVPFINVWRMTHFPLSSQNSSPTIFISSHLYVPDPCHVLRVDSHTSLRLSRARAGAELHMCSSFIEVLAQPLNSFAIHLQFISTAELFARVGSTDR